MWTHHPEKTKDISPWFFWSSITEAAFPFHWAIPVLSIMIQTSTSLRSEQALTLVWGIWSFDITPRRAQAGELLLRLQPELVQHDTVLSLRDQGSNGFPANWLFWVFRRRSSKDGFDPAIRSCKDVPTARCCRKQMEFIAKENKGQRLKYHSVSHVS